MGRLLFAAFLLIAPATASADIVKKVFGCTGSPCVVNDSPGGDMEDYQEAAKAIASRKWRLVINGDCYSACAIVADSIRQRTCITPWAAFYFHKAYTRREVQVAGLTKELRTDYIDPIQSLEIHTWIYNRGGYPIDGFRKMSYQEAGRFWKTCKEFQ